MSFTLLNSRALCVLLASTFCERDFGSEERHSCWGWRRRPNHTQDDYTPEGNSGCSGRMKPSRAHQHCMFTACAYHPYLLLTMIKKRLIVVPVWIPCVSITMLVFLSHQRTAFLTRTGIWFLNFAATWPQTCIVTSTRASASAVWSIAWHSCQPPAVIFPQWQ